MSLKTLLIWPFSLLLACCAANGLDPIVLDGHELHASLKTAPLDVVAGSPVTLAVLDNPHLSTDTWFVEDIARRSSQGGVLGVTLDGEGIRAALLAVYIGEGRQLGIYGLEAVSTSDADRIEGVLRRVWSHNEGLDLARIHRRGEVLVVVWAPGSSPSYWHAVNADVARRLGV